MVLQPLSLVDRTWAEGMTIKEHGEYYQSTRSIFTAPIYVRATDVNSYTMSGTAAEFDLRLAFWSWWDHLLTLCNSSLLVLPSLWLFLYHWLKGDSFPPLLLPVFDTIIFWEKEQTPGSASCRLTLSIWCRCVTIATRNTKNCLCARSRAGNGFGPASFKITVTCNQSATGSISQDFFILFLSHRTGSPAGSVLRICNCFRCLCSQMIYPPLVGTGSHSELKRVCPALAFLPVSGLFQ